MAVKSCAVFWVYPAGGRCVCGAHTCDPTARLYIKIERMKWKIVPGSSQIRSMEVE